MLVDALDRESQRRREILLVAEQDVDERDERPIHVNGLRLAAGGAPEGIAIVQIVGHDDAVPACGLHRFARHVRRRGRQRAENPAGVEPA